MPTKKGKPQFTAISKVASPSPSVTETRQLTKVAELEQTLVDAGFVTLDDQAAALGMSRDKTWTILRSKRKAAGLSAATIKRMLRSSRLPSPARRVIQEYVEEKCAGDYGHSMSSIRTFRALIGERK
jgi:hypothetical protein